MRRLSKPHVCSIPGLLAVVAWLVGGIPSSSTAAPGDLLRTIPNPGPNVGSFEYFGRAVVSLGDSFIVSRHLDDAGAADAGSVYQFTSNGEFIRRVLNPAPFEDDAFGFMVTAVGDNFAVAHRGESGSGSLKRVDVFDGITGRLLNSIIPSYQEGQILTATEENVILSIDQYTIAEVDPLDGNIMRSYSASGTFQFGSRVIQRNNQLIVGSFRDIFVFDRGTGELLSTIPSPQSAQLRGLAVDFEGNLVAKYRDIPGLRRFDGETHGELEPFVDILGDFLHRTEILYSFGRSLLVPDIYHNDNQGIIRVYDAVTGAPRYEMRNPAPHNNTYFGQAIAAVGSNVLVGVLTSGGSPIDAGVAYLFEGLPDIQPGDTNADGVVDLSDLNNVRNNFGGAGLGDTNGDNLIDLTDLNNVRNHFGESVPTNNAVPEPQSWALALAGVIAFFASSRLRSAQK